MLDTSVLLASRISHFFSIFHLLHANCSLLSYKLPLQSYLLVLLRIFSIFVFIHTLITIPALHHFTCEPYSFFFFEVVIKCKLYCLKKSIEQNRETFFPLGIKFKTSTDLCSYLYLSFFFRESWDKILFLCSFFLISWRLITLQYCSDFCHMLTRISYGFTCIPHPDPPSHLPLHLIPLGLPSAPGPSTCLVHPT